MDSRAVVSRIGLRPFGIETEHAGLIGLSALFLLLLQLGDMMVVNVAETLFVKRVGPTYLPLAYVAQGLLLLGALNYVGAALDRGRRIETLRALIVVAAAGPLAMRALVALDHPVAYGAILVLSEGAMVAITVALWTVMSDLVPGQEARRVAAPILVAGLLGEALGSFLTAPLAFRIGIENLLTVATLTACAAGLVLHWTARRMLIRLDVVRPPKLDAPHPGLAWLRLREHTREAVVLARRSTLLRFLLATTAIGAALGPFVDFQFHSFANATFEGELDLLLFYSLLKGLLGLAAIGLQLMAFNWLRREAGVANTLLTLPLGAAVAFLTMLFSGGVAAASLVWAMLRLSIAAVDEPARRFLHDLFPMEVRDRVDWLINRNGRALAVMAGGLVLFALLEVVGPQGAIVASVLAAKVWLIVAIVLRARYGQLVLATSLANRIDFDQMRAEDVSELLDRGAIRLLEREVASGVPARAQLAIELLRSIESPRLPQILAASYARQPPVLRPLFLTTIQETLRTAEPGWPGLRQAALAVARLARTRLSAPERAILVRVYGDVAARHGLDRREVEELLEQVSREDSAAVRLAVAGARYRVRGAEAAPALDAALVAALAQGDEENARLAIGEIEDLAIVAPAENGRLLEHLVALLAAPDRWPVRVRAHAIQAVARVHAAVGQLDAAPELDRRIVPLALDADPRLAASALEYLRDARFVALL